MCAPIEAEVGPSARTREGALLETLAGSVRCNDIYYTRSWGRAYSPVKGACAKHAAYWRVYLS
jgi:hypothetical protein